MGEPILLTLEIYALAIVISMAVALVIAVIGTVMGRGASRSSREAPLTPVPTGTGHTMPPAEHLAVIAAAVATMGGAHRIVHIEERRQGLAWAAEGRSAHHASHAPSRRGPGRRR